MKDQIANFMRWLFAFIGSFISRPRRVQLIVTAVVIVLALALLLIPTLTTLAGGLSGGGS